MGRPDQERPLRMHRRREEVLPPLPLTRELERRPARGAPYPVTERVLSTRELNRALLGRQLLQEGSKLPLTRALERVGGLQSQYAPSAYVALWSRLHLSSREALTTALEQRRAVQATLMRATIHVVSARDFPLLAAPTRKGRREWWLRAQGKHLKGIDMETVAARIRKHLSDGPRRHSELMELLKAEGFPRIAVASAGMWVDLVRVPPSGTWEQRRADLYGLAGNWLDRSNPTEAEGLQHLVRRYLGGFGPASLNDLSSSRGCRSRCFDSWSCECACAGSVTERAASYLTCRRGPCPTPYAGFGAVSPDLGRHTPRARPAHPDPA